MKGKGFINYYDVLEISRTATPEEIKKSYRKLAKDNHPDLFPNASEEEIVRRTNKFQEIVNAYEILGNDVKRQNYDKKLANYESIQEKARREREAKKRQEKTSQENENSQQNREPNYSTTKTQHKHEERKGRHAKENESRFGKFTNDIKQTWNEVRKEEMKAPFFKRHKSLNGRIHKVFYKEESTTSNKVVYCLANGTLHIFGETLFQLEKLTHITEDTIPKYIIRNRNLITTVLLIAVLASFAGKDQDDNFTLSSESSITYQQQTTETPLEYDDLYFQTEQQEDNQDYKVYRTYEVQSGDNLTELAKSANTSIAEIKDINKKDSDTIKIGETIYIPYNIKEEDLEYATITVDFPIGTDILTFAEQYSTNVLSLYELNKESFINDQVISNTLLVPTFASQSDINQQKATNTHVYKKCE